MVRVFFLDIVESQVSFGAWLGRRTSLHPLQNLNHTICISSKCEHMICLQRMCGVHV